MREDSDVGFIAFSEAWVMGVSLSNSPAMGVCGIAIKPTKKKTMSAQQIPCGCIGWKNSVAVRADSMMSTAWCRVGKG
jgi:hypothetical protein